MTYGCAAQRIEIVLGWSSFSFSLQLYPRCGLIRVWKSARNMFRRFSREAAEVLKVYYAGSKYFSHSTVARSYVEAIRRKHRIVSDVASADLVILHAIPPTYPEIFAAYPTLRRKYVVGYCVWEASDLPEIYKRNISRVREIWTCSQYCKTIFGKYHSKVIDIPHIVERNTGCSDPDRDCVKQAVHYEPGCVYYLAITKIHDKRKNVLALIKAFQDLSRMMPMRD